MKTNRRKTFTELAMQANNKTSAELLSKITGGNSEGCHAGYLSKPETADPDQPISEKFPLLPMYIPDVQ